MKFTGAMFLCDDKLGVTPAVAARAAYVAQKYFESWLEKQKKITTLFDYPTCAHTPIVMGDSIYASPSSFGKAYLIPEGKARE